MKSAIQLTAYTAVSAMGDGLARMRQSLLEGQSKLSPCDFEDCDLATMIRSVSNIESEDFIDLQQHGIASRNNLLAYRALQQDHFSDIVLEKIQRYGHQRIGVVLGTSTSGFKEFEHAYQQKAKTGSLPDDFPFINVTDFFATAAFIANTFSLTGPCLTINTACSSSAKAMISARRLLLSEVCDAVIVAGVDSLCLNTLYGFHALQLLSPNLCQPCDANRQGLNIGEAAAIILLERGEAHDHIQLLGYGESSDGHHMSSPHPQGEGAILSMQQALQTAALKSNDIDYINMHGTASRINDAVEDKAIFSLFQDTVCCSSSKGLTGHTLGAAGALEVIISCLCIELKLQPACFNTTAIDSHLQSKIILENKLTEVNRVLTNSFGFGGNNCSLILGRPDAI